MSLSYCAFYPSSASCARSTSPPASNTAYRGTPRPYLHTQPYRQAERRAPLVPAQRQEQGRVGLPPDSRGSTWHAYAMSDGVRRRRRGALQTTAAGSVAGVSLRSNDAVALCRGRAGGSEEKWGEGAGLGACGGVVMQTGSGMTGKVCWFLSFLHSLNRVCFASVRDCYVASDGAIRPSSRRWWISHCVDHHTRHRHLPLHMLHGANVSCLCIGAAPGIGLR